MLVEKAGDLTKLVNQTKLEARNLLREAVDTGDIRQALNVFMVLQDLLPKHSWIIDSSAYPLARDVLDGKWTERYSEILFADKLDEEFYIVRKDGDWGPQELEAATALAWEIVKNGHSGYCNDW